ncbi:MAG: glutamate-5-semialdehyde dehydrogenase [Actinomycetota bacterium]|nr:glutamate-5-semialdehyde dehydrogenase [Actinomycetota bacterium]
MRRCQVSDVELVARKAKEASFVLASASTLVRNNALLTMAKGLESKAGRVIEENKKDLDKGRKNGLSDALIDRLTLDRRRIIEMAQGLREVAALPDPLGEIVEGWTLPNGLIIEKVRVPLGVVGIIYEARPNVTVDTAGLCIKSGNSVVLRGSSSAMNSNRALVSIIREMLKESGLPADSAGLIDSPSREAAKELMKLNGLIDVLIPRGGAGLISTVVENSAVPVIETGLGNCHVYVDLEADLEVAQRIIINAKTQRPGVCNACETVLVHSGIAEEFLPKIAMELEEKGVEIRGCERTRKIVPGAIEATEDDWKTEYLDLILAVKVVDDLDEAIGHINKYGSKHSDAIVTDSYKNSQRFTKEVDSACVYVNASTRFTDGGQFGLGAEIGISTQKLHARGPMSVTELTSAKFVIRGSGQVRD